MRIKVYDGLKGVGCFIVFMAHFYGSYYHFWEYDYPFIQLLFHGSWAVCLFLLLSGFSISWVLFDADDVKFYQQAIIKRYFRFFIPIALIGIFYVLLYSMGLCYNKEWGAIAGNSWMSEAGLERFCIKDFLNFEFFVVWDGRNSLAYNNPLWVIPYLFRGTFMVILLSFSIHKLTLLKQLLLVIVFAFLLMDLSIYYTCMIIGVIPCICLKHNIVFSKFLSYLLLLGGGAIPAYTNSTIMWIVSVFLICIGILSARLPRILLEMRYVQYISKISFQIYLVHMLVLHTLTSWLWLNMQIENYWLKLVAGFIITTPVVFGIAHALNRYIDTLLCPLLIKSITRYFFHHK